MDIGNVENSPIRVDDLIKMYKSVIHPTERMMVAKVKKLNNAKVDDIKSQISDALTPKIGSLRTDSRTNKLVVTEEVKGIFIDLTSLNERLKAFETLLEVEEKLLQWIGVRAVYGEISSIALNTVNLEVLRTKAKILNIKQAIIEKRQELEWVMNTSIPEGMDINYR